MACRIILANQKGLSMTVMCFASLISLKMCLFLNLIINDFCKEIIFINSAVMKKVSSKRYSKKKVDQNNNHVRGWVTARAKSIFKADEITC